jgi:hypothetical protein
MGQDHYWPTRDPFHIGMWQLAHVKAYMGPILPRINTGTSNYCLSFRLWRDFPECNRFSQQLIQIPSVFSKSIQVTRETYPHQKWH